MQRHLHTRRCIAVLQHDICSEEDEEESDEEDAPVPVSKKDMLKALKQASILKTPGDKGSKDAKKSVSITPAALNVTPNAKAKDLKVCSCSIFYQFCSIASKVL